MKISLHRQVVFAVSAGLIFCGLLPLGGCNKDKVAAVSAADAAALAATAADGLVSGRSSPADGGVACVFGDAPQRTLSDAITPDAIMQAMTLVADWQLAN